MNKGYIFMNEDETFQGIFCEPVNDINRASIHDSIDNVMKDRIYGIIEVEYEWIYGMKIFRRVVRNVR
jgi:hypothetical protein